MVNKMKMIRYTRDDLKVINKAKFYLNEGNMSIESYKIFMDHMKSKLETYRK